MTITAAQRIFNRARAMREVPVSDAYNAGCLRALRYRAGEVENLRCPHADGTCEADAFRAGSDEGQRLWSRYAIRRYVDVASV